MNDRFKKNMLIFAGAGLVLILLAGIIFHFGLEIFMILAILVVTYIAFLYLYSKNRSKNKVSDTVNRNALNAKDYHLSWDDIKLFYQKTDGYYFSWDSGLLDEIKLVYQKADDNEKIREKLLLLEEKALEEAVMACMEGGLLAERVGSVLEPVAFMAMPEIDKETAVKMLADMGISSADIQRKTAEITIKLSPYIRKNLGCTMFKILNFLEKLDGSAQVTSPKWQLNFLVPLEGKKGLGEWELFIMMIYPWIHIHESSTNEIAV